MEEKYIIFLNESKILRKSKQRLKRYRNGLSTIKVDKTALSSNDDKRMQTLDCKNGFEYGTSKKKDEKIDKRQI